MTSALALSRYGSDLALAGQNGLDGYQTVTIPISDFHLVGNVHAKLYFC